MCRERSTRQKENGRAVLETPPARNPLNKQEIRMSFYSHHHPEAIDEVRYFGIDPKEAAAGLANGRDEFDSYNPADLSLWTPEDEAEQQRLCAAAAAEVGPIVTRPAADLAREALAAAVGHWNDRHSRDASAYAPPWMTLAEAALRAFEAEDAERDRYADQQEAAGLAKARAAGIDPFA
jgi:hypothetical protein